VSARGSGIADRDAGQNARERAHFSTVARQAVGRRTQFVSHVTRQRHERHRVCRRERCSRALAEQHDVVAGSAQAGA
jgi:hypothetical protein